jgi:hypothetical protein
MRMPGCARQRGRREWVPPKTPKHHPKPSGVNFAGAFRQIGAQRFA